MVPLDVLGNRVANHLTAITLKIKEILHFVQNDMDDYVLPGEDEIRGRIHAMLNYTIALLNIA